jgi:hypothetical protein
MNEANSLFHGVVAGDGSPARPWHLEDVSKNGARLRIDAPGDVPDRFTLAVKGDRTTLITCRVVWRSAAHVGVKFERP